MRGTVHKVFYLDNLNILASNNLSYVKEFFIIEHMAYFRDIVFNQYRINRTFIILWQLHEHSIYVLFIGYMHFYNNDKINKIIRLMQ